MVPDYGSWLLRLFIHLISGDFEEIPKLQTEIINKPNTLTTPEKSENAALLISTERPTVHTNSPRKRRISKTLLPGRSSESILKTEHSENDAGVMITMRYSNPTRVFVKHKSKMVGDCRVLNLLQRYVDEKHL